MSTKTDQTSKFADHLERTLDLVFKVSADTNAISSDLSGAASFTNAALGQFDVDLAELGEADEVLETTVTPSSGTATITSTINASKEVKLSVDSSVDLSLAAADFVIRAVIKRSR